jgi:hypothetical protein
MILGMSSLGNILKKAIHAMEMRLNHTITLPIQAKQMTLFL